MLVFFFEFGVVCVLLMSLFCFCMLLFVVLIGLLVGCGGDLVCFMLLLVLIVVLQVKLVKIGIVLGGGVVKGFVYIGVIKMLEVNGFELVVVVGISVGSVVGVLYVSGMDVFQMQSRVVVFDEVSICDVCLFFGGLVQGQKLQDYVNEQVVNCFVECLKKLFVVVVIQLEIGECVIFVCGNVGQVVCVLSSIFGVFELVKIGGCNYIDGGVVSLVLVDVVCQFGVDFVIVVDIFSKVSGKVLMDMLGIVNQFILIMGQCLGEQELVCVDIVIWLKVLDIGVVDFSQCGIVILEGEKVVMVVMLQICVKIQQLQCVCVVVVVLVLVVVLKCEEVLCLGRLMGCKDKC